MRFIFINYRKNKDKGNKESIYRGIYIYRGKIGSCLLYFYIQDLYIMRYMNALTEASKFTLDMTKKIVFVE